MNVKQSIVKKLEYAYVKCLKNVFNFHKFASVTGMLLELGLPSFRTLRHNALWGFSSRVSNKSCNTLVRTVDKFCVTLADG